MIVQIDVYSGAHRKWQACLKDRLSREGRVCVTNRVSDPTPPALPAGVGLILDLERLTSRIPDCLFDVETHRAAPQEIFGIPDVIIDCAAHSMAPNEGSERRLLPLFDGQPGELGLLAALLAGRMPHIQVVEAVSLHIVAQGRPSGESAGTLSEALDSALSRLIEVLVKAVRQPIGSVARNSAQPTVLGRARVASYMYRRAASSAARWLYHLCCNAPHWKTGWRIHEGPTAFEAGHLGGEPWQVLPDDGSFFCADPFPVTWQGRTVIFFELVEHRLGPASGLIAGIEVDLVSKRLVGSYFKVLQAPTHLSYPFTFSHAGSLWMIPENSLSGQVILYRCVEFPRTWVQEAVLVDGVEAADPTVFLHSDRFWMTAAVRNRVGGYSDMLTIYHASSLRGPWEAHRQAPLLIDAQFSRPGGAVFWHEGALVRPVQNCLRKYGESIEFLRIEQLTPDDYEQSALRSLTSGASWRGGRVHTWNRAGPLECIDGIRRSAKLRQHFTRTLPLEAVRQTANDPSSPSAAQGRAVT